MSTDRQHEGFTNAEILNQAQGNAMAAVLGLMAYARERGDTPDEAARWLGRRYAPGWETLQQRGAYEVARMSALNAVSVGATLEKLTGDEHRAQITLAGLPSRDILDEFSAGQDEADAVLSIFEVVAGHIGYRLHWTREGDTLVMTYENVATE